MEQLQRSQDLGNPRTAAGLGLPFLASSEQPFIQRLVADEHGVAVVKSPWCGVEHRVIDCGVPLLFTEEFEVVIMIAVRDRRDAWVGPSS